MRLVLLGAPGAGKGTYGEILSKQFNIPKISTGDILRQAVVDQTPLGKQAKSFMDAGHLAPDDVIINMVGERLRMPDAERGFILDGFPRTLAQAHALNDLLVQLGVTLDLVVNVDVNLEVIIRRLTNRRMCQKCGANFNVLTAPSKLEGICDLCGETLIQRSDDHEEVIQKRFAIYEFETKPLVSFYRGRGMLQRVDSDGQVADVVAKITDMLKVKGVHS